MMLLCSFLLFSIFYGIFRAEQRINQARRNVSVEEGGSVILDCAYASVNTNPDLFWYIQYPNEAPKYMLRRGNYGEVDTAPEYKEKFNANLDKTAMTVPLTVQNVQLSDSAVYYCALRLRVRMTFSHPLQNTGALGL
uniref:Ig-like domain-containing protein n=1 Tax=Paramormyrops kingsleyae TaxID=1676925 RepID=A0A3B3Q4R1_9TELE